MVVNFVTSVDGRYTVDWWVQCLATCGLQEDSGYSGASWNLTKNITAVSEHTGTAETLKNDLTLVYMGYFDYPDYMGAGQKSPSPV